MTEVSWTGRVNYDSLAPKHPTISISFTLIRRALYGYYGVFSMRGGHHTEPQAVKFFRES